MTRKCFNCGTTKGLKALTIPDCDCGKCDGFHDKSVCKSCYFSDLVACEMDFHSIEECLTYEDCENHKDTVLRKEHWDELDYNYQSKKVLTKQEKNKMTEIQCNRCKIHFTPNSHGRTINNNFYCLDCLGWMSEIYLEKLKAEQLAEGIYNLELEEK